MEKKKTCQVKDHTVYDSTYMRGPGQAKPQDRQEIRGCRGLGRGKRDWEGLQQ